MQQLKWTAGLLGAALALIATVFSAYATAPGLTRGVALLPSGAAAPLAACTKMTVTDVAWVTVDDDGEIEDQVKSYEQGVTTILGVFEYNCVPKKTTISSVFYLDGEVVYSDKENLKASNNKGLYGLPLGTTDGSPMNDGEWTVEYYNGKTLLSSGTVVIGEGGSGSDETNTQITVQGKVADKKTKKPIKGAVILVLKPGVSVQDFIDGGQKKADVFTGGQSDSKGKFTLQAPLERGGTYAIVVVAKGYKPIANDDFTVPEDADDPLEVNVNLTK